MNKYQTLREKNHPENSVFPNIDTQNIPDAGVTTVKIADGAITTAKIATGAVTNAQLATDAVDTSNIVAGAVTATKIGAGAVTSVKIAANAVTTGKISDLAVTTGKLAGGAVTAPKVARTWKTLYDIFNDLAVTRLVDAVSELIKLLRDGIVIQMFYSTDAMVAEIQSVKISVYGGEIYIYNLKSGGWSEFAHITSDAGFSTFMSNDARMVYLLVMPQ